MLAHCSMGDTRRPFYGGQRAIQWWSSVSEPGLAQCGRLGKPIILEYFILHTCYSFRSRSSSEPLLLMPMRQKVLEDLGAESKAEASLAEDVKSLLTPPPSPPVPISPPPSPPLPFWYASAAPRPTRWALHTSAHSSSLLCAPLLRSRVLFCSNCACGGSGQCGISCSTCECNGCAMPMPPPSPPKPLCNCACGSKTGQCGASCSSCDCAGCDTTLA